ncbi:MAG: type II toxin-antitoxin system HicA family toxin [Terracidiphilus sp.]
MKLPRDVDGTQLVKALSALGYEVTRQKGSHIRVTTQRDGENHEVIPCHRPIKAGTLASMLKHIAAHHGISVQDLLKMLDL